MYLTNLIKIVSIAGVSQTLFAQPVSISNESVPVEYYRMPDKPLDHSFSTYSSDIDSHYRSLSMTGLTESELIDHYLFLSGYKKVGKDGDVQMEATIGDFNIFSERTDTRRTKKKNKEGKEEVNYSYAMEVKYELPISLKIKDKNGNTLEDEYIFAWNDDRTYTSSYYYSLSDLDSYWRINRNSKLGDLQRDRIKEGFGKIKDLVNNDFGYRLINENVKFEKIGKKKHPDYDKYDQAVEAIKTSFKLMKGDLGLNEVRKSIASTLTFYDDQNKSVGSRSKDDIKLKHIILYNQALAYFWLEDFDQASEFAKEIQKLDQKDKDAKKLLEEIESTINSLERANQKSRHGTMAGGKA